jgi:hypothetical protein
MDIVNPLLLHESHRPRTAYELGLIVSVMHEINAFLNMGRQGQQLGQARMDYAGRVKLAVMENQLDSAVCDQ